MAKFVETGTSVLRFPFARSLLLLPRRVNRESPWSLWGRNTVRFGRSLGLERCSPAPSPDKRAYRNVGICPIWLACHVPIRRAGGKAVISRLAEGAIDGATLRGVDFRVASGLLLARDQRARKYVADTTYQFYWSSVADWQGILLRRSISVILL